MTLLILGLPVILIFITETLGIHVLFCQAVYPHLIDTVPAPKNIQLK